MTRVTFIFQLRYLKLHLSMCSAEAGWGELAEPGSPEPQRRPQNLRGPLLLSASWEGCFRAVAHWHNQDVSVRVTDEEGFRLLLPLSRQLPLKRAALPHRYCDRFLRVAHFAAAAPALPLTSGGCAALFLHLPLLHRGRR